MRLIAGTAALMLVLAACGGESTATVPQVVPDYVGEAVSTLTSAGLRVEIDGVPPIDRADGGVNGYAVTAQDPAGGASAEPGSTVRLEVAMSVNGGPGGLGREGVVSVPTLTGVGVNEGIAQATEAGLYASVAETDRVLDVLVVRGQSLAPGDKVPAGTEIVLTLE